MTPRNLQQVIRAMETSDGAGVKLRRSIGQSQNARLDPFLMLDEFGTDNPDDYIAGFPDHPHRGFETVTYMLDGHMLHRDHMGNRGDLKSGDVQWMTAGRGIIHSEMPQQLEGRMRGFQLWINLPALEKMKPASYRDIPAAEIPAVALVGGGRVKVIAGTLEIDGQATPGPIQGLSTAPLYFDVELVPQQVFRHALPAGHNAFLYVYEGGASVGEPLRALPARSAGILSDGDQVSVTAGDEGARFILLAGKPLREPVVQYGPFVMNSREEIEQAIHDYQNGRLASPAR
ncbi:MAG: pirin family protein [Burkholderiales bacterium]